MAKNLKLKKKKPGISKFLYLVLIPVALLFFSLLALFVGDRFFVKDNLTDAEILYKMSKATNPFNSEIDRRLWAIRVINQEKVAYNQDIKSNSTTHNEGQKVLGASVTVPVLMYHYIRINPDVNDKTGFGLSVTPYNFDAQMEYLVANGYTSITLDELGAALFNNAPLPTRPIVITFDDGYEDAYTNAFPVLKKYRLKGTSFVTIAFVGLPKYLNWEQIKEMKDSGNFYFESHSVHHYALTYVNSQNLKYELSESKKILEEHLGYPVNWFAYPYGNLDTRVANLVKEAGYVGALSTKLGAEQSESNIFALPRIRIGGGDSVSSFASKLPWK